MQIQKKKSQSTLLVKVGVTAAILLIIVGGYAYAASKNNLWPFAKEGVTSSTPNTTIDSGNTTAPQEMPTVKVDSSPASKTPKPYEQSGSKNSTAKGKLTGVINYKSVSNGKLSLRVTIDQKLAEGTCKLVLTNQTTSASVKQEAIIIANPSSSTCEGFDIPTSQLGSGSWNIVINLASGGQNGQITGNASL